MTTEKIEYRVCIYSNTHTQTKILEYFMKWSTWIVNNWKRKYSIIAYNQILYLYARQYKQKCSTNNTIRNTHESVIIIIKKTCLNMHKTDSAQLSSFSHSIKTLMTLINLLNKNGLFWMHNIRNVYNNLSVKWIRD